MRTVALLAIFSWSAFAAAPLAFTFEWEQGEHSRDASGSRSKFTLEGTKLTKESKSWGRIPVGRGEEKSSIKLTAAQLEDLRAAIAATEKLTDVRVDTKQDIGPVIEASLTVGKNRVLVLEAYPTNQHVRGPKAEILDPDPTDTEAAARPSAKTYAAMNGLYLKLLGLFPLTP